MRDSTDVRRRPIDPAGAGLFVLLGALGVGFVACTEPATEIVVVVQTDLAVPAELDAVQLTVVGGASRSRTLDVSLIGENRVQMPLTLGVVPRDDPNAAVAVTAIGRHGADEVVRQTTSTRFVEGQTRTVLLNLLRSCIGSRCETGQTCDSAGCRDVEIDPSALPRWTGRPPDAGLPDPCPPGVDVDNDPLNCGRCGNVCPSIGDAAATCVDGICGSSCEPGFHPCADGCQPDDSVSACGPSCTRCPDSPGAAATCDGLACGIRCDPGFGDCNDDPMDGCERDTRTSLDCGDCDVACRPPTPFCGDVGGNPGCVSSCSASETQCGDTCVSLMTDARHCGACDMACPDPDNGAAACASGRCGLACDEGFHACGASCVSDTSPATCGLRCEACEMRAGATTTCRLGECGFLCMTGRGDCDRMPGTGCETDVTSSTQHCGMCGNACTLPFAVPACRSGVCIIDSCEAGRDNCDATAPGCETDVAVSTAHCGRCGHACGAGATCMMGICSDDPVAVVAGVDHTCALLAGGSVRCWGANTFGQLGGTPAMGFAQVGGLTDAVELTLGAQFGCARRATGAVVCWGRGDLGQLGDGRSGPGIQSMAPVAVLNVPDAVSIAAGNAFACAARMDGSVLCWGEDASGQLGDGMAGTPRADPMQVVTITDALSVAAGGAHACVRSRTGTVSCWGFGTSGQLGNAMMLDSASPVAVMSLSGAPGTTLGDEHSCSADAMSVVCWGNNARGQLGDGTVMNRAAPVVVSGFTMPVLAGDAGGNTSCLVSSSGAAFCWGAGDRGQLGVGEIRAEQRTPAMVVGLTDALRITCGAAHCCALRTTGALDCWGANDSGQLGIGRSGDVLVPTAVIGL